MHGQIHIFCSCREVQRKGWPCKGISSTP
ncbi:MAG: SWIM zinc finger family protein [Nitrospirae bacterium]|nr:SWIM zinc finger family protein [Nitrospirota bacterium]